MRLRGDFTSDATACAAQARLKRHVLELDCPSEREPRVWKSFAFFEPGGPCAATLEAALLPLVVGGVTIRAGAIRAVATHPNHRGRGLFRTLMEAAQDWFQVENAALALLYSADPVIYSRFGFKEVPQHSFVGDAPAPAGNEPGRRLQLDDAAHRRLIGDTVIMRGPVSSLCSLQIDPDQYIANLRGDPSLSVIHCGSDDSLLVFEQDREDIRVVDLVTREKPDLARVIGCLPRKPHRLRTMFAPDRLDWHGRPELESTGLMMRGDLPLALAEPFMLPPTVEF